MRAGTPPAGPQQPVRLLYDDDVPQALAAAPRAGSLAQAQVLDDPDDQRADQESLVLVVGDILDGEHSVPLEQFRDVSGVAAFEEPAGRPGPQRAQPDVHESPDIRLELRAVADIGDHLKRGSLQLRQGGNGGRHDGSPPAPAPDPIPTPGLLDPPQRPGHAVRGRPPPAGRPPRPPAAPSPYGRAPA